MPVTLIHCFISSKAQSRARMSTLPVSEGMWSVRTTQLNPGQTPLAGVSLDDNPLSVYPNQQNESLFSL
jgi:hypothetical protein